MRSAGQDRRRLAVALALHGAALAVHLFLVLRVFEVSDVQRFHAHGSRLAAIWRADPMGATGPLLSLFAQRPTSLDHDLLGGSATDTMVALSAALHLVCADNLVLVSALVTLAALGAKWTLYRALSGLDPEGTVSFFAVCCVPSAVFWSAGLLKETVAIGLVCLGLAAALNRRGTLVVVAAAGLWLVRPWLVAAALPASLALLPGLSARWRYLAPLLGCAGGVVLAEWGAGAAGLSPLSHRLAWHQAAALADAAGSHAPLVGSVPETLWGQLPWVLPGVATAWFRPGLWEVGGVLSAAAALENLALVVLFGVALRRASAGFWTRRSVAWALVAAAVAGGGIGLVTANLGTLSRYRAPLLPLLWWVALAGALRSGGSGRSPDGLADAADSRP